MLRPQHFIDTVTSQFTISNLRLHIGQTNGLSIEETLLHVLNFQTCATVLYEKSHMTGRTCMAVWYALEQQFEDQNLCNVYHNQNAKAC